MSEVVYLPDAACVLAPAGELFFNDASWLDAEGLRLAHPSIGEVEAETLGVQSMR